MVTVFYKPSGRGSIFFPSKSVTETYPGSNEATFEEKEILIKDGKNVTVILRENVQKVTFDVTQNNEIENKA